MVMLVLWLISSIQFGLLKMLLTWAGRMGWLQEAHLGAKTLPWKRQQKLQTGKFHQRLCCVNQRTSYSTLHKHISKSIPGQYWFKEIATAAEAEWSPYIFSMLHCMFSVLNSSLVHILLWIGDFIKILIHSSSTSCFVILYWVSKSLYWFLIKGLHVIIHGSYNLLFS